MVAILGAGSGGCVVHAYQPLSGFHRPIVVDPSRPNLADTRLDLHCMRGEVLSGSEALRLCERTARLFLNQGAEVEAFVGERRPEDEAPAPEAAPDAEPRTQLRVELRAREIDASTHPLSWLVFAGTLTVLPGIVESTFEQQIVIRDATGFLLVSDSLTGRLVHRYGFGPWFGNQVLNLLRKKVDRLDKEVANRDLSNDMYRQLSQDVFNARVQAQILQQTPPVGRAQ